MKGNNKISMAAMTAAVVLLVSLSNHIYADELVFEEDILLEEEVVEVYEEETAQFMEEDFSDEVVWDEEILAEDIFEEDDWADMEEEQEPAEDVETEEAEIEEVKTEEVETVETETEEVDTEDLETEETVLAEEETEEYFFEEEEVPEEAGAELNAGECGTLPKTVFWQLNENGLLHIYGEGEMIICDDPAQVPWDKLRDGITGVQVDEGVTTVCAYAFYSCSSLADIDLAESVEAIGAFAFKDCGGLQTVTLG